MKDEGNAIFGFFRHRTEVEKAQKELFALGFSNAKIETLYSPNLGSKKFNQRYKTMIGGGILAGATIGGFAFAAIGMPANIAAVAFSPALKITAVVIIAGIIFGAISGALVGIGVPQRACKRLADYVRSEGVLMSVEVNTATENLSAAQTLKMMGAQDVSELNKTKSWKAIRERLSADKLST